MGEQKGMSSTSGWNMPSSFPPITSYVSGANTATDIRGLIAASVPVGATVSRLSESSIQALLRVSRPIFLDSGAFSEVSFHSGKIRMKRVISDSEWRRRLEIYLRIARLKKKLRRAGEPSQVTVVAPDRVGSQRETLRVLRKYQEQLVAIRDEGADIIVPLQLGRLNLIEFQEEVNGVLGFPIVPGIPMNKAPHSQGDILFFISEARPTRIHFLGMGMRNRKAQRLVAEIVRLSPLVQISLDSNQIRAAVGKRRPISIREQTFRGDLLEHWSGEVDCHRWDGVVYDMTELLFRPSAWFENLSERKEFASALIWCTAKQRRLFVADPDAFIASAEADDWLFQLLTDRYVAFLKRQVGRVARSHAVAEVFQPAQEEDGRAHV